MSVSDYTVVPEYTIGIDVGGTRIKCGAVTRAGEVLATNIVPTGFVDGPERLVDTFAGLVTALAQPLGRAPAAVAFGMPGYVEPQQGVSYLPVRIRNLEGFPLVAALRARVNVPVVADNDGRLMIYAERAFGLARDVDWAVCVAIGTGVGTAVLLDGQVLRDPTGGFGTLGAFAVIAGQTGPRCFSGARGTVESLCSATALALRARDALARGVASSLLPQYEEEPARVDFRAVADAARAGDALAQDCVATWASHLSDFIVTLAHVYTPQRIILSGGGALAADLYIDGLHHALRTQLFRDPRAPVVDLVVSQMEDRAGMLGAAALAWQQVPA